MLQLSLLHKTCSKCGVPRSLHEFSKCARSSDGLLACCKSCKRIFYQQNKERILEQQRVYGRANKERKRLNNVNYRAANLEKRRAQDRAYNTANAERIRLRQAAYNAANSARILLRNAAWKKSNKARVNAIVMRRNATRILATPAWASSEKIAEFYFAADFLSMVTGEWHEVDHIVPLLGPIARSGPFKGERLVCGLHCETNLQVLPAVENCSKSNRYWPYMP
jgi:hypothetical protein